MFVEAYARVALVHGMWEGRNAKDVSSCRRMALSLSICSGVSVCWAWEERTEVSHRLTRK